MVNQARFDNRYVYDYIYPRGRSGETLRAIDTQDDDRPVVIKRPAPQDAPPLRAAQEVNILSEKKALERLSGHPVATALRGSGIFRAGGDSYTYIAMDRAEGQTLEEMVLGSSSTVQALPELEILAIIDQMLDLLIEAHAQHVIYNDVDAKHLFWNRDGYHLKMIDWGNAVMTDEKGGQKGVSIASDIYQVGELLYFVYQHGRRFQSETDPQGNYAVHFHTDLPDGIAQIITRATHPNIKSRRYGTMRQLREALRDYRKPILAERDSIVRSVEQKLHENASKALLQDLRAEIQTALALDPGYPLANELAAQINLQLQYLAVQADFDAARIYLQNGNWERAVHLIEELIPDADAQTQIALNFLVRATQRFQLSGRQQPPEDFDRVIDHMLRGASADAARLLLAIAAHDRPFRDDTLIMLDYLAELVPDVILLRPALTRLEIELADIHRSLSDAIGKAPRSLNARISDGITPLIDRYAKLAIQITDWMDDLDAHPALLPIAERAETAARQIVTNLKHAAASLYGSSETALAALDRAEQIDPANKHIPAQRDYITQLAQIVGGLGKFRPNQDGSDIPQWANTSRQTLAPYIEDTGDRALQTLDQILYDITALWDQLNDWLILGRRAKTIDLLNQIANDVQTINTPVADWLRNTARLLMDTPSVEKFTAQSEIATLLLDGYAAWGNGQAGRAAEFARRAGQIAQTDGEQHAVERLRSLADLSAEWLNKGGIHDHALTDRLEQAFFGLLLDDEQESYATFSGQMPSEDLYLKAMKRGIVDVLQASSTAGYRALFAHYVLRGVMEIQQDRLDDADFWRTAALTTNPTWKTHPLFTAFDGELTRRRLVLRAESALNDVQNFDDLAAARETLNAPLADQYLKDALGAVDSILGSLNDWADGDYRSVNKRFKDAIQNIEAVQKAGEMDLSPFYTWFMPYTERMNELVERRLMVEQAAMEGSLKNDPKVLKALEEIVNSNQMMLGEDYARRPKLWLDLYRNMLRTHLNNSLTKKDKLREFENNFSALFIDKHPAYRLFKRWQEAARQLPDDVEEDLQINISYEEAIDTTEEPPVFEAAPDPNDDSEPLEYESDDEYEIKPRRPADAGAASGGGAWNLIIIGAGIILLGMVFAGIFFAMNADDGDDGGASLVIPPTPTRDLEIDIDAATETAIARGVASPTRITQQPPTDTPSATATSTATAETQQAAAASDNATKAPAEPSETATERTSPTIAPTLTPSPVLTIVTNTPPPSLTPSPQPPTIVPSITPSDLDASVDVLEILNLIQPEDYEWDATFFSRGAGGTWQLGASVEEVGSAPIAVVMQPDFMEAFNPDTATRIQRAEINMELVLFDEDRLAGGGVFFGFGLQNSRRQRYGAQVTVRQVGIVSLGMNENGTFRGISQIPLDPINVTLSFERNADGSAEFFINGQRLDASPTLFPSGEPISLVIYHAGGGMFVNVSDISLELSPLNAE